MVTRFYPKLQTLPASTVAIHIAIGRPDHPLTHLNATKNRLVVGGAKQESRLSGGAQNRPLRGALKPAI